MGGLHFSAEKEQDWMGIRGESLEGKEGEKIVIREEKLID